MIRFFFLFSLLIFCTSNVNAADEFNQNQQEEVRKLVRDTLLSNPEILMEAMKILQERQEQASQEQQKAALAGVKSRIKGPLTPSGGNPKGDITFVEFFDYQCGYCKRAFPGVMKVITEDKNIHYIFKEFAILGPESEIAARAALGAQIQGKHMEFHIAMMSVNGRLSEDKILKTAESIGLKMDQLKADMKSDEVSEEIASTRKLAQELNISGTPAFIIGDEIIPGAVPAEALKEAIAAQREKQK